MTRRITGLKPTGHLQLGNLLAAIAPMVAEQRDVDTLVFLADLHALTVTHDPHALAGLTREAGGVLLAAGLDPDVSLLFAQSQVPEHAALHYLLESTAAYGEVARMIQFREKARSQTSVRLSLLTYPTLMAADILLYAGVDHDVEVPVGDDQGQHLELTRDLAARFNHRYGATFGVPVGVTPASGARIMDLADPRQKMEKTNPSPAGVIYVLDPPDVVRRKVARAVTDAGTEVRHDPAPMPGITNLLEILRCITGRPAPHYARYAELKRDVSDAVLSVLEPLQTAYAQVMADPAELDRVLAAGAARASALAAPTLALAQHRIGLLASA